MVGGAKAQAKAITGGMDDRMKDGTCGAGKTKKMHRRRDGFREGMLLMINAGEFI